MGRGDTLASGGVRATWGPLNVTQKRWEQAVGKKSKGGKGNVKNRTTNRTKK